jgi:hypothetical protein
MSFGKGLYDFYSSLADNSRAGDFPAIPLPPNVETLNPYNDAETLRCVEAFCARYYRGDAPRLSVWGINPGRFGGGLTGLSFTDPVILREECDIPNALGARRELSAEFVWSVIRLYGGAEAFFNDMFLTAMCPLGFARRTPKGGVVNYNFYDDARLAQNARPFILRTMERQSALGLRRGAAICLGSGKLYRAFTEANEELGLFERVFSLEHPRFIMQYRRSQIEEYRQKYDETFRAALTIG